MATFGYARASTKLQIESPETQKSNIGKYAGLYDLGEVTYFVDIAKSGKVPWEQRDAGRDLFARLKPGDNLIVAKLDRAFRRLSDCVAVLEKFEQMKIKLHVTNMLGGAIDLSSPMGRFLIHILAAFAELERAFISERTRDGLAGRKRKSRAVSAYPGYGFEFAEKQIDGKLVKIKVPNPQEREVMQRIVRWRADDPPLSWDEISRRLLAIKTKHGGTWDPSRVRRAFRAELQLQLEEQRESR